MKKSRLIATLAAVSMLASSFAPMVQAGETEAASDPSEWPVVSVDVLSFTDGLDRKDEVQQALNDYLASINAGVQAEFVVNTWGDRNNNLTMLLSDKDNPIDLFSWRFYSSVDALVKNDQIISLEPYKETYPDLFTMYPEKVYKTCQIDGQQYSLPSADSFCNFSAYMLRKSVAEDIGVADMDGKKVSLDELNDILTKAEEAYPDQGWWSDMKATNVIGFDTLGDDYWLGVLQNRGIGAKEVVNAYKTEEFRKWCEQTKWYNDNGMVPADPENTVPTGTLYQDLVVSGGYLDGYGIEYMRSLLHGQGHTGEGDFILLQLNDNVGTNASVVDGWCISSLCKNPDAAMKLLYLMTTDENVCRYFTLGIEGVTYKVDENGCAWMADGVDDSTLGWNLSAPWKYPNQCLSLPYNTDYANYYTDMQACWTDDSIQYSDGMGFIFDSSPVYDQIKACQMIVDQYRDALLYGEVDVDEYLEKFNEELDDAGINDVIEEKNKQFQEFLKSSAS
jgi:hypothetical protein